MENKKSKPSESQTNIPSSGPSKDYMDHISKVLDKMNSLNGEDPKKTQQMRQGDVDGTGMPGGFDQLGMSAQAYIQKIQREKYGK